jgi:phospholipid/cholesterol/gamma-HCH transport system ATP-binding protein
MVSEPIIEVRDLVSHYGTRKVLDGVSLSVFRGEIFVIMGASGAGKSTLLRNLLGLNPPTAGSIRILAQEVTELDKKGLYELRRNIGVAFQGGALFSSMTVSENVQLPLREHTRLDPATIEIMTRMKLEMMNLAGFEHLMPAELSGGMRKRAGLARAAIMDPKVLFFDEPSAGLDPVTSVELDELILKLRNALNMTVVIVTHELQSALKIADRISILGDGRMLMTGTVEEVQQCADPRVQGLLRRRPRDEQIDGEAYLDRLTGDR